MNIFADDLDEWVDLIFNRFNDLNLLTRREFIANVYGITDLDTQKLIDKASIIAYGKKIGVETFEDACKKLGYTTEIPVIEGGVDFLNKKLLAYYKLSIIIKAVNGDYVLNLNDVNNPPHVPFFDSNGVYSYTHGIRTSYPSSLLIRSSELAHYCGKAFNDLYKEIYF